MIVVGDMQSVGTRGWWITFNFDLTIRTLLHGEWRPTVELFGTYQPVLNVEGRYLPITEVFGEWRDTVHLAGAI